MNIRTLPKNTYAFAVICALAAAVCMALKTPLTKLVVEQCDAITVSAYLHLGMMTGMLIIAILGRKTTLIDPTRHLRKKDTPNLILIILAGTAASLMVNFGLINTTAATGVVLNNFTLVATALLAFFIFKEKISKRLWIAIMLITFGAMILTITDISAFEFTPGALLILGGTVFYGFSNNIMKKVSERNPVETSIVKAFGVSLLSFSLMPFFSSGLLSPSLSTIIFMMIVGMCTSGLGFLFTLYAQRKLGVAKTATISSIYPMLGIIVSWIIFSEIPDMAFGTALLLVIPGLYFVITKNKNSAAAGGKNTDSSEDKDTQFFVSINESRKNDMRNILTSFGLLAIALFFVMMMLDMFDSGTADAALHTFPTYLPGAVLGVFTLLCGVILLLLGKRVMTAVTFILMAVEILSAAILNGIVMMNVISGIFGILFAIILLTSKDPQKYAFAIINVLLGFTSLSCLFDATVCGWIMAAAAVFLIWLSIACGTEKLRTSIAKYLTRNGDMTFRKCGPVIGYLLISVLLSITLVYGYLDMSYFTYSDSVLFLGLIDYGLLIFVGLALMIIGKRKMTSIVFISCGLAYALDMITSGVFVYLPVVLLLVVGVMNIMWKDERVMPSLLLFGNAFMLILFCQMTDFPEVMVAMLILTLMCAGIALYLAFAVFSDKPKLPLF
ncbi:MAG TPA: DMT family transporter [Methanocorpusculum sp.]|nr:DMT family transporter [Methanocorpusculum sp.]